MMIQTMFILKLLIMVDYKGTLILILIYSIEGLVSPLIREETFYLCQEQLKKNSRNYYRNKKYLFAQKIKCPKFGRIMCCNGTRKSNQQEYLYYKCKACKIYIREEYIEEAVITKLNELLELHLALDNNCFPIETDLAEDFNKCKANHKVRFQVDKR